MIDIIGNIVFHKRHLADPAYAFLEQISKQPFHINNLKYFCNVAGIVDTSVVCTI